MVLRRLRLQPRHQRAPAVVAEQRVLGTLRRPQALGRALHRPSRLRRLPLREQRRQRLELGQPAGMGHLDDVRLQDEEQHRVRAVAVVQRPQDDPQRQVAGLLDRRHALHPRGRSQPSGIHQLVEVDRRLRQLRRQRRLPLRRGLPVEPQHDPGRPLALRRGVPGRARPQVRRPVHEGAEQLPGRLLPELRQLPLPVPLDPERPVHAVLVRRHRPQVLQPEGHDQPVPHRAHRRLHGCSSSTISGRPRSG